MTMEKRERGEREDTWRKHTTPTLVIQISAPVATHVAVTHSAGIWPSQDAISSAGPAAGESTSRHEHVRDNGTASTSGCRGSPRGSEPHRYLSGSERRGRRRPLGDGVDAEGDGEFDALQALVRAPSLVRERSGVPLH